MNKWLDTMMSWNASFLKAKWFWQVWEFVNSCHDSPRLLTENLGKKQSNSSKCGNQGMERVENVWSVDVRWTLGRSIYGLMWHTSMARFNTADDGFDAFTEHHHCCCCWARFPPKLEDLKMEKGHKTERVHHRPPDGSSSPQLTILSELTLPHSTALTRNIPPPTLSHT